MTYRIIITILALSIFSGCEKYSNQSHSPEESSSSGKKIAYSVPDHPPFDDPNDEIAFVLFHFIFENNASGGQQNVDYFFISVDSNDPPEEFMTKFVSEKPKVLPASLADGDAMSGVSHKELGGRGLIFGINEIKWLSKTKVEVSWWYYESSTSGSGNTATLQLKDGKWIVTDDQMHWISKELPNK